MAEEVNDIINKILSTKDVYKKAQYIDFLRTEKNITLAQISRLINLKPSYTAHIVRLIKLPEIIIDGYYSKLISATHLFIISRLYTPEQMIRAYEKVLAKSLPAHETEHFIREILYDIKVDSNMMTKKELSDFTEMFKDLHKGVNFKIIQTRLRGKIICEIKGGAKDTSLILRKLAQKLTQDNTGVKRVKKDLFVLE